MFSFLLLREKWKHYLKEIFEPLRKEQTKPVFASEAHLSLLNMAETSCIIV